MPHAPSFHRALAVAAALSVLVPAVVSGVGGPTFASALVSPHQATGEPSMLADTRASPYVLYATAPSAGNLVWRSADGGATWAPRATTPAGGGDADLAMDADGVLYASDLLAPGAVLSSTIPVSVSYDEGASWARSVALAPDAGPGVSWDRQWIEADGHGHVVVTARGAAASLGADGDPFAAWVSTDAARHFAGPITIATDAAKTGKILDAGGVLYAPYATSSEVRVAKSTDGGLSWVTVRAAPLIGTQSLHFPSLAVDAAGHAYLAWATDTQNVLVSGAYAERSQVFFVASTDGGLHWSTPVQLSDGTKNALFPTVVAGGAGHVDVAYYSQDLFAYPDVSTPATTWDVVVQQSLDADAASPKFASSIVVQDFHTGSICTGGLTLCPGPQQSGYGNAPTPFDRRDLDFFGAVADQDGRLVLTYPSDRPMTNCVHSCAVGDLAYSWVDINAARQTGGSTLS